MSKSSKKKTKGAQDGAEAKKAPAKTKISQAGTEVAQVKTETFIAETSKGKSGRKPLYPVTLHIGAVKGALKQSVEAYKRDLDPDKLDVFKRESKTALKKIAVGSVIAVAAAALLIIPETYYDGKIAPRTTVAGVKLGSIELAKAKSSLLVETDRFMKTPIIFVYGEKRISMTPEELGVKPDPEKTLIATPVNRFTKTNPMVLAASLLTSRELPLVYGLDYAAAAAKIGEKLEINGLRARNARLVLLEEGFAVEPEKAGKAIDENLLTKALRANISSLKSDPVTVAVYDEAPRVTAVELEKQKPRLEALLRNEVTLVAGDKELVFKPADHLDAVEYKETTRLKIKDLGLSLPVNMGGDDAQTAPGGRAELESGYEIALNAEKAMPFLKENLLDKIEIPTSGVTITRDPDGKINIEGKGEDGKSVPVGRLMSAMALAVNNGMDTVPVPVVTEKAPVKISSDLQDLGIKELLTTGHTSYYGSPPNRMHNINVGIAKYNGVIVKPGEEFSFNMILGEVDARNGYLPEKVIKKNKLELEYGGGICQVSTTLYRAVLLAGLPVTERNPHSWKVSYYGQVLGHGLDATIYIGVSDVKFVNDTPGHLLIQSYTDGANAYFKFYGTSDGRTTELDGPYGGGLHYKWYRIIKKNGEEIKETIVSNYKPIPPPDPPPAPASAPAPVADSGAAPTPAPAA